MHDDHLESNADWRSIPLCCRYSLVRFERLSVQPEKIYGASFDALLWGLGVLPDGQYEVMGAWPDPESSATEWADVFEDLRARGVEHIGAVVGAEIGTDLAALRNACQGAASLGVASAATPVSRAGAALSTQLVAAGSRPRPLGTVSLRHPMVQASDDVTNRIQASAERAIARHGPFGTVEAFQTFTSDRLRRAEQKLARVGLGRLRAIAPPVSASPSWDGRLNR